MKVADQLDLFAVAEAPAGDGTIQPLPIDPAQARERLEHYEGCLNGLRNSSRHGAMKERLIAWFEERVSYWKEQTV